MQIALAVLTPTKCTLQTGAVLKSVPAVREESRLKSHFILSRVWTSLPGWRDSIDR